MKFILFFLTFYLFIIAITSATPTGNINEDNILNKRFSCEFGGIPACKASCASKGYFGKVKCCPCKGDITVSFLKPEVEILVVEHSKSKCIDNVQTNLNDTIKLAILI
ncbi:2752_t:CDS:2 [Entrophospora sp. SA101]|nr:2752_t:CDS:2 [Entrophospora sp. SA101]